MDVINLKLVDIEYNDFLGNLVRGTLLFVITSTL
jgi:hypothetical protein